MIVLLVQHIRYAPAVYEFIPIILESYTSQKLRAERDFRDYLTTIQRRKYRPEQLNNLLKVT